MLWGDKTHLYAFLPSPSKKSGGFSAARLPLRVCVHQRTNHALIGYPALSSSALEEIGRIGDALIVLLAHFHPPTPLSAEDSKAIDALKEMLAKIADVKEKHSRPALRPRAAKSAS